MHTMIISRLYLLIPAALLFLLLPACKEEEPPVLSSLDLASLPIVFVMEAEQAAMATVTGTGGNDNSGRSNTDRCCPSIQLIDSLYAADLMVPRPEDAFIPNPFGVEISTDPRDPIVIGLEHSGGATYGPFSLEVGVGEGIAINTSKLAAGEYSLELSVGAKSAAAVFTIDP